MKRLTKTLKKIVKTERYAGTVEGEKFIGGVIAKYSTNRKLNSPIVLEVFFPKKEKAPDEITVEIGIRGVEE